MSTSTGRIRALGLDDRGGTAVSTAIAAETCPVCGSLDVRVVEPAWFAIDLDRAADLRDDGIEFRCRDCVSVWG